MKFCDSLQGTHFTLIAYEMQMYQLNTLCGIKMIQRMLAFEYFNNKEEF